MPGKHAPESPKSFYYSLARFFGLVFGSLALVAVGVTFALGGGGDDAPKNPRAIATPSTRTTAVRKAPVRTTPVHTPTSEATPSLRPPARVTVNVLNATSRNGLAAGVARELDDDGYRISSIRNANGAERVAETTIFYRSGARAEAEALLDAHPELKRIARATPGTPTNALLTVVLASDYSSP